MTDVSFFEHITQQFDDALPFVAYRKPNSKQLRAFYQDENSIHYNKDFTESGFVFAPFDNTKKSIIIPDTHSIDCNFSIVGVTHDLSEVILPEEDSLEKEMHLELVQKGILKINEGGLKKVVLSRKRTFPDTLTNPITIFKKLLQRYTTAFVYIWYHPSIGLWLGATPETLLEIKNRTLYTMSLAGTQRYTPNDKITWGAKEKEEQQLVTDTIVTRLQPLTKNLSVGAVENHKAGNLLHLKTPISARLDETEVSLKEVINALHPTPAVCGLPVEKAKAFIIDNENYDRSYYTGFLGELNLKNETHRSRSRRNVENLAYRSVKKGTHLFVNLRCMEQTAKGMQVYIGGGITSASIPEAEWEETRHKLETMGSVLF